MNLDTLLADLDQERLILTWRGIIPVREDDLADVQDGPHRVRAARRPGAAPGALRGDPRGLRGRPPGDRAARARGPAGHGRARRGREGRRGAPRAHACGARAGVVPVRGCAGGDGAPPRRRPSCGGPSAPPGTSSPRRPHPPRSRQGRRAPARRSPAAVAGLGEAVKSLRSQGAPGDDLAHLERLLDDPQTKKRLAALVPPRPEEIGPGKDLSGPHPGRHGSRRAETSRASTSREPTSRVRASRARASLPPISGAPS